ncbi:MAG: hypothetical protein RLW61_20250 [Gammaproteobacteria bacterium]
MNRATERHAIAALCILAGANAPAIAAPVTYAIDQAFWGTKPIGSYSLTTDVWQAQRADAVAADPGSFSYVNGTVTIDWEADELADYDLNLDLAPLGTSVRFRKGAPEVNVDREAILPPVVASAAEQLQLYMSRGFGPQVTITPAGGTPVSAQQYRLEFDFVFNNFTNPESVQTLLLRADIFEFQELGALGDYGCLYFGICSTTADYAAGSATVPDSQTYGGYGIAPAPVPLPAPAALLASALAALGIRRQRAQRPMH